MNNNFDNSAAPRDRTEKIVKYVGHSAPVNGLTANSVERQEKQAQRWEGRDAAAAAVWRAKLEEEEDGGRGGGRAVEGEVEEVDD